MSGAPRSEAATTNRAAEIVEETGALFTGHFRLTSGRHSGEYFQCARVLEQPAHAAELGRLLAERYAADDVNAIVSPALGGVIIGYEVARALGVRFLFAERQEGRMTLRRGFSIPPGERILIIEDVVTTGGSVKEVAELVRARGASVIGFGFIVDRSAVDPGLEARTEALLHRTAESFAAEDCPLCKEGVPIIKPGSRQTAQIEEAS